MHTYDNGEHVWEGHALRVTYVYSTCQLLIHVYSRSGHVDNMHLRVTNV